MLGELSLVGIELLLEERHLTFRMFVSKLPELALMLILLLLMLVKKVLLLRLNDHGQLGLLALHLFDQFLEVSDLLEVLDLLVSYLLVEGELLLLRPDLVVHPDHVGACAEFVSVAKERRQVVIAAVGRAFAASEIAAEGGKLDVLQVGALFIGLGDGVSILELDHFLFGK